MKEYLFKGKKYPSFNVPTLDRLYNYSKIRPEWKGFQYAHLAVIEIEKLGCRIEKGYEVHHLDGNPLNYSSDNLVLLTKAQHFSQQAMAVRSEYFSDEELIRLSEDNILIVRASFEGKLLPLQKVI